MPDTSLDHDRTADAAGRLRVLLVDDDPLNLTLGEIRLRDAGFAVETASTGEAALKTVQTSPPDAIVSDVRMPGMDGFALRQAVRSDERLEHIPFILVSSAHAEERQRRNLRDGDAVLVARSPDLHEAIEALASALRETPHPLP